MSDPRVSRRELLKLLAGTAACVGAAGDDFWNSKPPSEWDRGEIYRLMNHSPWAKIVTWYGPKTPPEQYVSRAGGGGQMGEMPLVGPKSVITWESARPVRDAMKTPSAPIYANFYVIGVDTIPNADGRRLYAFLRCAGKPQWSVRSSGVHTLIRTSMIYEFSFSRAKAPIGPDTGEVIFEINHGFWKMQSKFSTKQMLYRGQLAL